jgi:hypothetical protein
MTAEAICNVMANEIQLPDEEAIQASTAAFEERTGLVGCFGALDGRYFPCECAEQAQIELQELQRRIH